MKNLILIVEDEAAIADNIRWVLTSDGFDIVWVTNGSEALTVVSERKIDLVVLDIGLPDGSGIEFCKQIISIVKAPVIFLSSRASEVDKVVGLEIGADDYITKPFSPRELSARVKNVLRRTAASPVTSPAERLTFGPFVIDKQKMRVTYFSEELVLSKTEFRLLSVLVEQPGRVLSREQLMMRAWDEPDSALDRTVDAHIKLVRAKLLAVKKDIAAIVTHRGSGYSLKEDW